VPASVTRRSQDWTGHRLGGIKPGGPVNPHQKTTPLRRFFQLAPGTRWAGRRTSPSNGSSGRTISATPGRLDDGGSVPTLAARRSAVGRVPAQAGAGGL